MTKEEFTIKQEEINQVKGKVCTLPELAEKFHIRYYRIYSLMKTGKLNVYRNKAILEVPEEEVEKFDTVFREMVGMDVGNMKEDDEVTIAEAAKQLGKSVTDVIRLTVSGEIKSRKAEIDGKKMSFHTVIPITELEVK